MSKKNVTVGDIALVPIKNDGFVPVKVLYLSTRYRDIVLLGLYNVLQTDASCPKSLPVKPSILVYTSQLVITHGRWKAVGNMPLSEAEKGRAIRIVGGSVWRDDEELRPASNEDFQSLPKMQVLGAALVEKKARQLEQDG